MEEQQKAYRWIPDFNMVPLEYQKPGILSRSSRLHLLAVILIAAGLFAAWNFHQQKASLEQDAVSITQQTKQVQAKINLVDDIEEELAVRQTKLDDWNKLKAGHIDWPQILSAFLESKPAGVELTSLKHNDGIIDKMNVEGNAPSYALISEYQSALFSSGVPLYIIYFSSQREGDHIKFSLDVEIREAGS